MDSFLPVSRNESPRPCARRTCSHVRSQKVHSKEISTIIRLGGRTGGERRRDMPKVIVGQRQSNKHNWPHHGSMQPQSMLWSLHTKDPVISKTGSATASPFAA